jgi:hypothetical protein
VDVARLQAHDRRAGAGREHLGQGVEPDPSLVVDRYRDRRTQPQVPQREVHGVVALGPDEYPHPGRPGQPIRVQVPAPVREYLLPGGGEAGEVGHRRAGHEAHVGAGRQPQQVQQPAAGHLLDGGHRRGRVPHRAVLIPRGGQPVRGQRRRQAAADHPAVEAARRHAHQARFDGPGEQVDHGGRVIRPVGQRAERHRQLVGAGPGQDRPVGQRVQPGPCVPRRHVDGAVVGVFVSAHTGHSALSRLGDGRRRRGGMCDHLAMPTGAYFPYPDPGERIDPFGTEVYEPQFIDATNNGITYAYLRGAGQGIDLVDYTRRVPMGYTSLLRTQKTGVAEDGRLARAWPLAVPRSPGPDIDEWYARWGAYRVRTSAGRWAEVTEPNDPDSAVRSLRAASKGGAAVLLYVWAVTSWH